MNEKQHKRLYSFLVRLDIIDLSRLKSHLIKIDIGKNDYIENQYILETVKNVLCEKELDIIIDKFIDKFSKRD